MRRRQLQIRHVWVHFSFLSKKRMRWKLVCKIRPVFMHRKLNPERFLASCSQPLKRRVDFVAEECHLLTPLYHVMSNSILSVGSASHNARQVMWNGPKKRVAGFFQIGQPHFVLDLLPSAIGGVQFEISDLALKLRIKGQSEHLSPAEVGLSQAVTLWGGQRFCSDRNLGPGCEA